MRTRGYISYPAGQLDRIINSTGGDDPDHQTYKVRMVMTLRTEDPRYADKVNLGLWMGSAVWIGRDLVLEYNSPFIISHHPSIIVGSH
jgi:hypothetical protein